MPHYYLDIETTGLDPEHNEIITIQYQKIALDSGEPEEPLTILKSWDYKDGEKAIIEKISKFIITTNPFSFVPVGNNLNFEFSFLAIKLKKYLKLDINPTYFHSRPHIDLKHVMVILNGGRFKGYHLILKKQTNGSSVPLWYATSEWDEITKYVKNEAEAFTNFYSNIHNLIFNKELQSLIFSSPNERSDCYE